MTQSFEPIKHELGGGYYYTCHWLKCNEQLKRWWRYCPICGTKILWQDETEYYIEKDGKEIRIDG